MYRGGVFEKLLPENIHLIQLNLYKRDSIRDNYLVAVSDILKDKLKQDSNFKMRTIYDIINPNIRLLKKK